MRILCGILLSGFFVTAVGCRSSADILDGRQHDALLNARDKARFLLSCPQATETLLSRRLAEPAPEGGWMTGVQRAEYTVNVGGCSEQLTFIVVCPFPGNDCLALIPGTFNTWQVNY